MAGGESRYFHGQLYETGENVRQDFAKARYWYEKAALQGDALAQCSLGVLYMQGKGVRQDFSKSFYWVKKSSDNGYLVATGLLAGHYELGYGVRQNKRIAKELYGQVCDKGNNEGCKAYRRLNEAGY